MDQQSVYLYYGMRILPKEGQGVSHSTGNPRGFFKIAASELNVPLAPTLFGSRRMDFSLAAQTEVKYGEKKESEQRYRAVRSRG